MTVQAKDRSGCSSSASGTGGQITVHARRRRGHIGEGSLQLPAGSRSSPVARTAAVCFRDPSDLSFRFHQVVETIHFEGTREPPTALSEDALANQYRELVSASSVADLSGDGRDHGSLDHVFFQANAGIIHVASHLAKAQRQSGRRQDNVTHDDRASLIRSFSQATQRRRKSQCRHSSSEGTAPLPHMIGPASGTVQSFHSSFSWQLPGAARWCPWLKEAPKTGGSHEPRLPGLRLSHWKRRSAVRPPRHEARQQTVRAVASSPGLSHSSNSLQRSFGGPLMRTAGARCCAGMKFGDRYRASIFVDHRQTMIEKPKGR